MASFTKWLLDHKVAVICVLVLLMALSVVGTILTDKESDVLSYLDPESDTSIGKQMLNEQYGIVGDTTIGISYLSREDIQRIVTFVDGTAPDGAYDGLPSTQVPTQAPEFMVQIESLYRKIGTFPILLRQTNPRNHIPVCLISKKRVRIFRYRINQ